MQIWLKVQMEIYMVSFIDHHNTHTYTCLWRCICRNMTQKAKRKTLLQVDRKIKSFWVRKLSNMAWNITNYHFKFFSFFWGSEEICIIWLLQNMNCKTDPGSLILFTSENTALRPYVAHKRFQNRLFFLCS